VGEDPPLLSASEIPTLLDRHGRLAPTWRQFLPRAAAGRVDPADLRREFAAQIEAVRAAGLAVDHLDTHQNIHLWPLVGDALLDVGDAAGIRVVRVTRSTRFGPIGVTVRRLARRFEAVLDARRWRYPAASAGLDEAGRLDVPTLVAAVDALGSDVAVGSPAHASAELATHPGRPTDADRQRYRWDYGWDTEVDALCAPEVRAAIDTAGFRLGTFADLAVSS